MCRIIPSVLCLQLSLWRRVRWIYSKAKWLFQVFLTWFSQLRCNIYILLYGDVTWYNLCQTIYNIYNLPKVISYQMSYFSSVYFYTKWTDFNSLFLSVIWKVLCIMSAFRWEEIQLIRREGACPEPTRPILILRPIWAILTNFWPIFYHFWQNFS